MTYDQFTSALTRFNVARLASLSVHVLGTQEERFGFGLAHYAANCFADLMFGGRRLGRLSWRDGQVIFDPPLVKYAQSGKFEDQLDEWAARAQYQSVIRQGLFPEALDASNDE